MTPSIELDNLFVKRTSEEFVGFMNGALKSTVNRSLSLPINPFSHQSLNLVKPSVVVREVKKNHDADRPVPKGDFS